MNSHPTQVPWSATTFPVILVVWVHLICMVVEADLGVSRWLHLLVVGIHLICMVVEADLGIFRWLHLPPSYVVGVHLLCMVVEVVLGISIVTIASSVLIVVGVHLIRMVVEVFLARASVTSTTLLKRPPNEQLCTGQTEMDLLLLSSHEDAEPAHEEGGVLDVEQAKSKEDNRTYLHVDFPVLCSKTKLRRSVSC
jgi:hypothetical protein